MHLAARLIFIANVLDGKSVAETLYTTSPEPLLKTKSSPLLVFGILSQPLYEDESDGHGDHITHTDQDVDYNHTYIAASYVKWLEDGGARSIPIPFDASPSLVEDILGQIDGVLFPGGASPLPSSAITIWEQLHSEKYYYPVEDNELGDRIPLWGTCLGMEFIVQLSADSTENSFESRYNRNILEKGYDSTNVSLPLFDVDRAGLYRPDYVYSIVTGYNVTMNNHHYGISPQRFRNNSELSRRFDITSTNYDRNGKAFVSTIEPSKRTTTQLSSSSSSSTRRAPPVYGVQYHPEKNTHEYGFYPHTTIPYESIDHSEEGIAFSLYEARFLVNLARENVLNRRQSAGIEGSHNSHGNKYNKPDLYPMVNSYPRIVHYKFEERYIIPAASQWEREINNKTNNIKNHKVNERDKNPVNEEREATNPMLRH